jgi:hypothetical protein
MAKPPPKGRKDRYAIPSPVLLERLRVWWRVARVQGKMLDGGWLLPGLDPVDTISTRNFTAPSMLQPRPRRSTSAYRCTH